MRIELRKAFSGWKFVVTFLILCIISAGSALYVITGSFRDVFHAGENPMLGVTSVYKYWMGNDWDSWFSSLYFFLFPIAAVMPAGLSLYKEKKTNYTAQMLIRENKNVYYLHKYLAAFISGGVIVCLPVILNIMVVALRFPFRTPDLNYDIYYKIQPFSFASGLFYTRPWLYLILRLAVIFLYAGLCAVLSTSVSFICRNRYIIVFTPQILFMVVNFCNMAFQIPYELSPIKFLGAGNTYIVASSVVFGEAALLIAVSLALFVFGRKRDVL